MCFNLQICILLCSFHYVFFGLIGFYYLGKILYLSIISLEVGLGEDESKHVLHTSLNQNLDAVRWNPANQDEVCVFYIISDEFVRTGLSNV